MQCVSEYGHLCEIQAAEGEVRVAGRLADCSATTTGMRHEIDNSNFWTLQRQP
jgi:hypothetical protein